MLRRNNEVDCGQFPSSLCVSNGVINLANYYIPYGSYRIMQFYKNFTKKLFVFSKLSLYESVLKYALRAVFYGANDLEAVASKFSSTMISMHLWNDALLMTQAFAIGR